MQHEPRGVETSETDVASTLSPVARYDILDTTGRRTTWWLVARLAIATVVLLGATWAVAPRYAYTQSALFGLSLALFASSTLGPIALTRNSRRATQALIMIDLALTTVLVWLTGGAASGFSFLYGLLAVAGALVLGPGAALSVAAGSTVLFLGLAWAMTSGYVSPPSDQSRAHAALTAAELATFTLSNVLGFVAVAALSANLARRVQRAGGQLALAEKRAAGLLKRTDDIVRSIASGLMTTNHEGLVDSVNPAAAQMFESTSEALVGRAISSLISGGTSGHREGVGRRDDGTQFPVGYRVSPLVDGDGQEVGAVWTFQDLTEITRLRHETARSLRLAHLGRLATGLAHEIRNPLTGISGSVELVRDTGDLGPDDARLLGIVLRETARLNALVDTMLRVGRPSPPHPTRVDLAELTREVVDVARAEAESSNVTIALAFDGAEGELMVEGDADQLRQVLWNLVRNALQASAEGTEIIVRLERTPEGIAMEVDDRGHGLSDEAVEHLFEMFYSGRAHGIGLGLALVQQIVHDHGGTVSARNRSGGGASFRVELPLTFPTA